MKDKLMSIFVAFVRKTFTKERLLDLIDDFLDIVYDRISVDSSVEKRVFEQKSSLDDFKEAMDKNV